MTLTKVDIFAHKIYLECVENNFSIKEVYTICDKVNLKCFNSTFTEIKLEDKEDES